MVQCRVWRAGLLAFLVNCWLTTAVPAMHTTISGCLSGEGCENCPADRYTRGPGGAGGGSPLLCCPGCAPATLYHGVFPQPWCVCHTAGDVQSRRMLFPGATPSQDTSQDASQDITLYASQAASQDITLYASQDGTQYATQDANYVLSGSGPVVAASVQRALGLLADTIEALNVRVTRLEDIMHRQAFSGANDLQGSGTVDRVGAVHPSTPPPVTPPPSVPEGSPSCLGDGFVRLGSECYFVSAWRDSRASWQAADSACERLGAKLAEPVTMKQFKTLAQYLSLAASTTGFTYWLGGVYLEGWRWAYNSHEVALDKAFWTTGDTSHPGDATQGRCLTFTFLYEGSTYTFRGDQCNEAKYYVCQLLDRSHRRL